MRRIRTNIVAASYSEAADLFGQQYAQPTTMGMGGIAENGYYVTFWVDNTNTEFRVSQDEDGTYFVWVE